jgi:hypothetical protein
MTKPWKIVSTLLIAVVIPNGMDAWLVATGWILVSLRSLIWDFAFWGLPNWVGISLIFTISVLWFALPLVGVVWLLLKIWKRKIPRITEGKG